MMSVKGMVQARASSESPWHAAEAGEEFDQGAQVRLGVRSAVLIHFANSDKTVAIDRLGITKIDEASRSIDRPRSMPYGRTRYDISEAGVEHESELISPSSTLRIRGDKVSIAEGGEKAAPKPTTAPTSRAASTRAAALPKLGDRFLERIRTVDHSPEFEMTFIPGGTSWMGSQADEAGRNVSEGPRHEVRVEGFWMGRCEVTAGVVEVWVDECRMLRKAKEANKPAVEFGLSEVATQAGEAVPSGIPFSPVSDQNTDREKYPAITLTAYGAQEFCRWLTIRTGRYYRLPSEAEWEYACRAGMQTAYFFGNDAKSLSDYAWMKSDETHPCGQKKANPWGLYDMYGNVGEYVLDDWSDDYRRYVGKVAVDPWRDHVDGHHAIVRGGDFRGEPQELRSASRLKMVQTREASFESRIFNSSGGDYSRNHSTGFRIISPLRREKDGRETTIPWPPSAWDRDK